MIESIVFNKMEFIIKIEIPSTGYKVIHLNTVSIIHLNIDIIIQEIEKIHKLDENDIRYLIFKLKQIKRQS